jgi:hypothetical protein
LNKDTNPTPREVIKRIREDDYEVRSNGERKSSFKDQLIGSLTEKVSAELYSDTDHFVLELVQNADDNSYLPNVSPSLSIQASPIQLTVRNNEIGFSEENVRALCNAGASSKKKNSGFIGIGEKGIGFKSVFAVTDKPEIHSNGFHFRFDATDKSDPFRYLLPHWIESPADDIDHRLTTIILPSRHGEAFSQSLFNGIDERLLLFLNKLRKLEVTASYGDQSYSREDKEGITTLSVTKTSQRQGKQRSITHYVRCSHRVFMRDVTEEKREGINESEIILAFPVTPSGVPDPKPKCATYAFLPIRPYGFSFCIQADFLLNSGREDILQNRPWNQILRDQIAPAFIAAIERFKAAEALAMNYLSYLPREHEIGNEFFMGVPNQIIELLRDTRCLPSEGGEWEKPCHLAPAGINFRALFTASEAKQLFGKTYLDARFSADDEILEAIECGQYTYDDIFLLYKDHANWLRSKDKEWLAHFFALLAPDAEYLGTTELPSLQCIPVMTGECVAPSKVPVFFPLKKGAQYGFEQDLALVDDEFLEKALALSEDVRDLLCRLGVKSAEPFELITEHILPKYEGGDWKRLSPSVLIGHVKYVKENLEVYLAGAEKQKIPSDQALMTIGQRLLLGTKHNSPKPWIFAAAKDLYLGSEYGLPFCIETVLGEDCSSQKIVTSDYLSGSSKSASDIKSWLDFLVRIGVASVPRVRKLPNGDSRCGDELRILLDSSDPHLRRKTLECIDRNWSYYGRFVTYVPKFSTAERDTEFVVKLRDVLTPNSDGVKEPLKRCFYRNDEIIEIFGNAVQFVEAEISNLALLAACQITYRVDVAACVKQLHFLRESKAKPSLQTLSKLYRHLERLSEKDGERIKNTFTTVNLIYCKSESNDWFKVNDVAWSSNGPILDRLYPSLQKHYRDFHSFFVKILGVPEKLPIAKVIRSLGSLGQIESPRERTREAVRIYKLANFELPPGHLSLLRGPEWLRYLRSNPVFIDLKGELKARDQIYVDDHPAISQLFVDVPDISFLAVSIEDLQKVRRFLEVLEVRFLSTEVTISLECADSGTLNAELTKRINRSVVFFARALYHRAHKSFEIAKVSGAFQHLQKVKVFDVLSLSKHVTLQGITRTTEGDVACSDDNLFIRVGARCLRDQVAKAICDRLEVGEDLVETLSRILMENRSADIEDYLQNKRIHSLPDDELALLVDGTPPSQEAGDEHLADADSMLGDSVFEDDANKVIGNEESDGQSAESSAASAPGVSQVEQTGLGRKNTNSRNSPDSNQANFQQGQEQPEAAEMIGSKARPEQRMDRVSESPGGSDKSHSNLRQDRVVDEEPVQVRISAGPMEAIYEESDESSQQNREPSNPGRHQTRVRHQDGGDFERNRTAPSRTVAADESEEYVEGQDSGRVNISRPTYKFPPGQRSRNGTKGKSNRAPGYVYRKTGGHSFAEPRLGAPIDESQAALEAAEEWKSEVEQAALQFFKETEGTRWTDLKIFDHWNEGFDASGTASDGITERIEVKGKSGAWTEEGVSLTPSELKYALEHRDRYWLCVVEFATDITRRRLYLVNDPFGFTREFRFSSAWKPRAVTSSAEPLVPAVGLRIELPGAITGVIVDIPKATGTLFKLRVQLEDGKTIDKTFNPATMKLMEA